VGIYSADSRQAQIHYGAGARADCSYAGAGAIRDVPGQVARTRRRSSRRNGWGLSEPQAVASGACALSASTCCVFKGAGPRSSSLS